MFFVNKQFYIKVLVLRNLDINTFLRKYGSFKNNLSFSNSMKKNLAVVDSVKRGLKAERFAKKILSKKGFKIINKGDDWYNPPKYKWGGKFDADFVCQKKGITYIIDVKSKLYKKDRTRNYFYLTKRTLQTFEYFKNKKGYKPLILAIIQKDNKIIPKFYDWNDFIIPRGSFKGKYGKTIRVILRRSKNEGTN